jgi:ABC-type phosphate transport system substrate-binding protein
MKMKVTIVMRTEYLAAIVIAVLAAGTGLAVNSVSSLSSEQQSTPAAAQLALAGSVDPFVLRSGG